MANLYGTTEGKNVVLKRFSMFDGAGLDLTGCTSYEEALEAAGINYGGQKRPIFLEDGVQIKDKFAVVKSEGEPAVLGIVGKNYTPISNYDALAVAKTLVDERGDMHYEAGGPTVGNQNLVDYSRVFLTLRGEDIHVGDDDYNSFVNITNSYDGTTGVRFSVRFQRLQCLNGMTTYLGGKKNQLQINVRHTRDVEDRLLDAFKIIAEYRKETKKLLKEIELFKGIKFTREQFEKEIIPMVVGEKKLLKSEEEEEKKANKERVEKVVSQLLQAYNADDVQNYAGNAYRVICALSDYETHSEPFRNTGNGQVYMNRVLKGMLLTTKVAQYIAATHGVRVGM